MSPDTKPIAEKPADESAKLEVPEVASHLGSEVSAQSLQANLSAIVSAHTGTLEAVGSAIAFSNVGGDATITASASPLVYAKGDVSVRQSYTSAVLAGSNMHISQAGAPLIVGKQLDINQGGGVVLLSGEANVSNGFVGVLLSPKATVSDDSRVLLSTKAALIIAAALLGGFGLIAVVMVVGMKRMMARRHRFHMPSMPHMPNMPHIPNMPSVAEIEQRIRRLREAS